MKNSFLGPFRETCSSQVVDSAFDGHHKNRRNYGVGSFFNSYSSNHSIYVTGGSDYATVAYDSAGGRLWTASYGGTGNGQNLSTAIAVDNASGTIYLSGTSDFIYRMRGDYATVALDPSGKQLWVARYKGSENSQDIAHAVVVDSAGNVYVTGESHGSSGGSDYGTVAYDSGGNQLWSARYDGPASGDDVPIGIAINEMVRRRVG